MSDTPPLDLAELRKYCKTLEARALWFEKQAYKHLGQLRITEARAQRLQEGIDAALHRYDRPDEPHNATGGFPRGELAWAMANDLRDALVAPGGTEP